MQFKVKHPRRCRHNGILINPGDVINATQDLAATWPDRFERVSDSLPDAKPVTEPVEDEAPKGRRRGRRKATVKGTTEAKGPSLRAIPKGGDLFDVVNVETGKPVNDSPLTEAEANSLVQGGRDGVVTGKATGNSEGA